ncbi:DUF3617 family protein [Sulfurimonas sp.]|uniref:DUF3617 domain-containing protein n=1 Tax=Sulfurimonas sp. TaxID=2022749 RepID=UPI0025FE10B0|nr:DUF3617 family protein [Sulfurimonas sp.]MDD5157149.1 DUF3617 family protein [Sulfurimonas sp.]
MGGFIRNFFLFSFFAVVSLSAKELDVEVGIWEWKSTMEMSGMSFVSPSYSVCLTKKDLVPKQSEENKDCKMVENKISKNSVYWKMECTNDGVKSVSTGTILYNKTTANGKIEIDTNGMTMISNISGKRTGACK